MGYNKISKQQAKEYIERNGAVLIDVRARDENRREYYKGSIYIPYTDLYYTEKLPQNKNQHIIVYCTHGGHSKVVAQILIEMGYNYVYDLGGIE